jgi:hypothetical protein
MAEHSNANQDRPISDSLHPLVNIAIISLVLMFVAAVWMFFDSGPYEAWLDVVVTGLFVIAIAIPTLLWLTWRRNADSARDDSQLSFRDWAAGDFNTLTGPVKGADATAEVLLPIAAVAVGMTVLGLVFHIIASGAA